MVLHRIMSGPPNILWPVLYKSFKNWIQGTFIVRGNFDKTFNITDFGIGARQAFLTVSDRIASGDTESLKGLVTSEVLDAVKTSLKSFSLSDRESIRRADSDIYFSFPYELGILMDDDDASKRWVEIMMVYHTLRGFAELQKENISAKELQHNSERFLFGNIRFRRNFSKNVRPEDSEWTVNYINYFNPDTELAEGKRQLEKDEAESKKKLS